MVTTLRKLQKPDLPGWDAYADSSGEMGFGEGGIIALLNTERAPGAKRVAELVEELQQAQQILESMRISPVRDDEQHAALNMAVMAINRCLYKYRWSPAIFVGAHTGSYFKVRYVIEMGKGRNYLMAAGRPAELVFERLAVQWIVDHVHVVHRVRRCRLLQCRKWFFAKTEHQKYCGGNCRQREASQGELFKEKRRIYMRKYRRDEAARDKRAKQLAGKK